MLTVPASKISVPLIVVNLIAVGALARVTVPPPNKTPVARSVPPKLPTQIFDPGLIKTYKPDQAAAAELELPILNPAVEVPIGPAVAV